MKVIISSKNPVKISSIQRGFDKVFVHTDFEYIGISVSSDVSDQPMTAEETYQGALNRIKNAKIGYPNADYYCGLEGGLELFDGQLYAFAWIIVEDNHGLIGKARTSSFVLPNKITELIDQGMELGDADDIVFKDSNSKQKQGAVGILTHDIIDRAGYYTEAVVLALIPFVNKELFT